MHQDLELVDDAMKVLRTMPADMQTNVALAILNYAANDDEVAISDSYVVSAEQRDANSASPYEQRPRSVTSPSPILQAGYNIISAAAP